MPTASKLSLEELRIKQAEFEGTRQASRTVFHKWERERRGFIKRFPASRIRTLTLDRYKVKSDRKNSFCYCLETKLQGLGDMHGATAFKFGIYYGKERSDPTEGYRWRPHWGNNRTTVFENVRIAIVRLLDAGKRGDNAAIKTNELSPMFKGKILATYFPDKFLNIFARGHLEFFLDNLGIPYGEKDNEVDERKLIMDFKNHDAVMSKWTTYEFARFLYDTFGRPPKKAAAQKELKGYIDDPKEYPKLSQVKSEIIDLKIHPSNKQATAKLARTQKGSIDFEKEARIHKKLGNRGEEIVMRSEQARLLMARREDLARKVERVSIRDDSLGYDIVSFDDDGTKRLIEVKSTTRSPDGVPTFLISSNQYDQAKKLKNYYFYVVFEAKSKRPKIWPIKNPLRHENKGLTLKPVSYRVTVNTDPRSGISSAAPGV
jgi:Protein NO VEIN, C-terminal